MKPPPGVKKVKATNPLAVIKAAKKKAAEKQLADKKAAEEQLKRAEAVKTGALLPGHDEAEPEAPALPAATSFEALSTPKERACEYVNHESRVIAPQYCRPREDNTTAVQRLRTGVPVPEYVKGKMEVDPENCTDDFLQEVVARRFKWTRQNCTRVYDFSDGGGAGPQQMNMEDELVTACKGMMERFDFTYGGIQSFKHLADGVENLHGLQAIEDCDESEDAVVSHAFCLVYHLFLLRLTQRGLSDLLYHKYTNARALALIYMRYTLPPAIFLESAKHLLLSTDRVLVREGDDNGIEDETYTLDTFIEYLLNSRDHPDFLEATFPAYTDEEVAYIKAALPLLRAEQQKVLDKDAEEAKDRGDHLKTPEQLLHERWERDLIQKAQAKQERKDLLKRAQQSALLPGFSDVGTQINWLTYNTFLQSNDGAAQMQAEMQRRTSEAERIAQKAVSTAEGIRSNTEANPRFETITELAIEQPQEKKKKRAATDSSAPKAKKKKESTKKADASRLSKDAASYLPEDF